MSSSPHADRGAYGTQDLGSLFTEALACNESEQGQLLDDLKQNEPELAEKLEQLLLSYHRFDRRAEQGKVADPRQTHPGWTQGTMDFRPNQGMDDPPPDQVGPYKIESELGRGAAARVFLAMQQSPERQVALKLIPGRERSSQLLKRFRYEYQALALMRHPNIATVFDVGQTPVGDAWIAMEYVPGSDLNCYCRRQGLDRVQRILLFMQVLDGMIHAHGQGVIHRDLKPSNIIAYNLDGRHMVKIIDFGLARSREQVREGRWSAVGTPAYMAPELLTANTNKAPNVAADIYALGMLFHEMMTDRHPIDLEALGKLPPAQAFRMLRETRPQLPKELPRDLGWIFAKATAHNPRERYSSASQFRDDIGRFLDHLPVLAAPQSNMYVFRKLVRRRRQLFAMLGVLLLATVSGFAYVTVSRDQAVKAREQFQEVNEFLNKMLIAPHPQKQGWDVRMVDVLENAELLLLEDSQKHPEVILPLSITLGETYVGLGLYEKAEVHLQRALKLAGSGLSTDLSERAKAYELLGKVKRRQEVYGDAEAYYQKAISLWRQVAGPLSRQVLKARYGLYTTWDMAKDKKSAQAAYEDLLAQQEALFGESDEDTLSTMVGLANSLTSSDKDKAASYYEQALKRQRKTLGPDDPATLSSEYNLAGIWMKQDRLNEAEALMKANLAVRKRVLGPTYIYTLSSMGRLGQVYSKQGRDEEAMAIWHELWDVYQSTSGPPSLAVRIHLGLLANTYALRGDNETALELYLELVRLCDSHQLSHDDQALYAMHNIGFVAMEMERYSLAAQHLDRCFKIRTATLGPTGLDTLKTQLLLSELARKQGDKELAKRRCKEALEMLRLHHSGDKHVLKAQELYDSLMQ
ncbi:MAG: tetratricopeptide repeat protein [Acidobacteriota bacterium]|nr:tetratricopeptide repeat protein [Acidobacteriota bacterium]